MIQRTSGSVGAAFLLLAACGTDDAPGSALDAAVKDAAVDEQQYQDGALDPGDGDDDLDDDDDSAAKDGGGESDRDGGGKHDGGAPAGPDVDRSESKLYDFPLDPKTLDSSVSDSLSTQYALLDTRTSSLGKLVIFLPGANNSPGDWRNHGRKLAEFGFHVLIPHYNNRWSSNGTCDGKGGSCGNDTRWEALVGEDVSSAIAIARADSAEGRVVTMLKHLMTAHPGGDWGYYLAGNDGLAYGKIIIAGISHGAASAGMYATKRPFSRNVMHSSGPAGDAKATKMTPVSAWYGFVHTEDEAYDNIIGPWKNFGVPGEPTNVDGKEPPFGNSHRLTTSAASGYPHVSTCVHSESPKDGSGNYVFEPVWRYIYGAPTD